MVGVPEVLRPFLEPGGPDDKGEQNMYCPLHDDNKRSASINFFKGTFYCHACEMGGSVGDLVAFVKENGANRNGAEPDGPDVVAAKAKPLPSPGTVAGWAAALQDDREALQALTDRRGLTLDTLDRFKVGWDTSASQAGPAYTIPIYDEEGDLVNVRWYMLDEPDERRKIWSLRGHGAPTLYPIEILKGAEHIMICEGEWDALLTIQQGFNAITRTGAADVWKPGWSELFKDKIVYVCHDMDEKGQRANKKIAEELEHAASEIYVVALPYEVTKKHGKDLSDYWMEGYSDEDFEDLLEGLVDVAGEPEELVEDIEDLRLIDTFNAQHFGKQVRVRVTVTGRRSITHGVPEVIDFSCKMDAGVKCHFCKMNSDGFNGEHEMYIAPEDPVILEMMDVNKDTLSEILRKRLGAPKCGRLTAKVDSYHTVEEIYGRPEVDTYRMTYEPGDYQSRKIVSVGRHDTMPNNTVEVLGVTQPHPKDQVNTLVASQVSKTTTSIDNFELTPEQVMSLMVFQCNNGSPLKKCVEIARDMARNVTHIYGRDEMHVLMDLAFHSVIGFEFEDHMERKGWLDILILGDTRTGKSEAMSRLLDHYGVGEMVSCEAASFAGIVGGLEQYAGREWVVRWGAIPINDRRLIALDEVSGLSHEEISRMSSIRSSGVAELTKIQSERTYARTRLVWMGNPRRTTMASFTYGVQGIPRLIGNNEDVARFDLAMTVASGDIASEVINAHHSVDEQGTRYTADLCHTLALWVWSRQPYQIYWATGTQDLIREAALNVGARYVDQPPLVQKENVRVKLARIAAAIAARTFNTFDGVHVLVARSHVEAAVQLLDRLYNLPGFGYAELSREFMEDQAAAEGFLEEAEVFLHNHEGLPKFLRSTGGSFRNQDLMDTLNLTKEMASAMSSSLWKMRMVRREGPEMKINPMMQRLLREVKER